MEMKQFRAGAKGKMMGEIFRELQADAAERDTRTAFEAWLQKRGTPLHLEHAQAYDAFKAGMTHQACVEAVRRFQRPLTRQQIDDVMTQHYPLSSLLREEVDAFEACVRDLERLHGIGA